MSFIEELKHRNVFRVGVAYIALGWVVIEVTDTLAPALNLPDWTLSLVTWIGIIGFPFALLFSWAFELTPEGLKLEKNVDRSQSTTEITGRKLDFIIIGLLIAAVVFLVVDNYLLTEPVIPKRNTAGQTSAAIVHSQVYESIAVLPFENLSDDPEQGYFADGLAEELLNALTRNHSLKVAARTSAFAFKGQNVDVREIGRTLSVATLLEGSVRKSGDRLRITTQLIDVNSGYHLWSETYDKHLTDVFEVQDEIVTQILASLKVHLDTDSKTQVIATTDADAYDMYLKGRQGLHQRTGASIEGAQRFFEIATARDPNFALAWAGQAQARYFLSEFSYGDTSHRDAIIGAQALIDRALVLDPELAEAHAVQALIYVDDGRYTKALASIARAIEINPGVGEFYLWRSDILRLLGQHGASQASLKQALILDPIHPVAGYNRVRRACKWGLEQVTETLFEPLERYPVMAARARAILRAGDRSRGRSSPGSLRSRA